MKRRQWVLESAFAGSMLGYAVSQWFHSAHRTILGVPARVVYTLGGLTAVLVIFLLWCAARWEE